MKNPAFICYIKLLFYSKQINNRIQRWGRFVWIIIVVAVCHVLVAFKWGEGRPLTAGCELISWTGLHWTSQKEVWWMQVGWKKKQGPQWLSTAVAMEEGNKWRTTRRSWRAQLSFFKSSIWQCDTYIHHLLLQWKLWHWFQYYTSISLSFWMQNRSNKQTILYIWKNVIQRLE